MFAPRLLACTAPAIRVLSKTAHPAPDTGAGATGSAPHRPADAAPPPPCLRPGPTCRAPEPRRHRHHVRRPPGNRRRTRPHLEPGHQILAGSIAVPSEHVAQPSACTQHFEQAARVRLAHVGISEAVPESKSGRCPQGSLTVSGRFCLTPGAAIITTRRPAMPLLAMDYTVV